MVDGFIDALQRSLKEKKLKKNIIEIPNFLLRQNGG